MNYKYFKAVVCDKIVAPNLGMGYPCVRDLFPEFGHYYVGFCHFAVLALIYYTIITLGVLLVDILA